MTLSYNKFMLDVVHDLVDLRCTVCGAAGQFEGLRLDDAIEWAESHQCAPLRVT